MWFVWLSDQQKVQLWQTWTRKCDTPISAASCVVGKKTFVNKWNMERHTKKDHGLTEKGNVIENSAGIAIFTTEALVKEKVSEARLSHK